MLFPYTIYSNMKEEIQTFMSRNHAAIISTILIGFVQAANAGGCPEFNIPVMEMCKGGHTVGSSLLIDFYESSDVSETYCKCSVLIVDGKKLEFSQVSAPDYQGCGTEIHLQKDNAPHGGDIIRCYGGVTMPKLEAGDTVTIGLYKHAPPMDTRYCYRLDIKGSSTPSMSVTCDDVVGETSEEITTSVLSSVPTTEYAMTTMSTDIEETNNSTINASSFVGSSKLTQCNTQSYFIGFIVMLAIVVLLLVYSVVLTTKLLLSFLRQNASHEEHSSYTDIYEEIPAKQYMSSRPVYNESFHSQREQSVRTSIHSSSDQVKTELPTLPTIHKSHWNWAYEEPSSGQTIKHNQHPVYEYENAAF